MNSFTGCRWRSLRRFLLAASVGILGLVAAPRSSRAQETVVTFDPAHTQINMTLDATAHTVHGTFKLKSGTIQFDPHSGKAQGAIVIDATSGNTGNSSRDNKMHQQVLESAQFPEISFSPAEVKGSIPTQGAGQVLLTGTFRIHGQDHPLSFVGEVASPSNGSIHVKTSFSIPYEKWGMKNPSNFFLHVGDSVEIEIDAVAQLSTSPAATP
jgi:polyisoprenoid-binding protein YceI